MPDRPSWPTPYEILGVPRDADDDAVRRAHRRLAQHLHPDVAGGHPRAEERYRVLSDALAVLRDPAARRALNGRLEAAEAAGRGLRGAVQGQLVGMVTSFAAALHPPQEEPPPERGADHDVRLRLDFAAATRGGERTVELPLRLVCLDCGGTGGLPDPAPLACHVCEGRGGRTEPRVRGGPRWHPCPLCGGLGRLHPRLCAACDGRGSVTRRQRVALNVPPGSATGAVLHLPGRGGPGRHGGEPGDLRVHLAVAPHALLRREGRDLHVTVPLAVGEAARGAAVPVPTLDGAVTVEIPPGAGGGEMLRLRGRGVPGEDGAGDLYLHLFVEPPTGLDEAQQAALVAFEAALAAANTPRRTRYRALLDGGPEQGGRHDG